MISGYAVDEIITSDGAGYFCVTMQIGRTIFPTTRYDTLFAGFKEKDMNKSLELMEAIAATIRYDG